MSGTSHAFRPATSGRFHPLPPKAWHNAAAPVRSRLISAVWILGIRLARRRVFYSL